MSTPIIYQLPTPLAGSVDVFPVQKYMVSGDNLATVTAAGYLNSINLEGYPVTTTDIINMLYSFNNVTKVGTFEQFSVSISNGVITLSPLSVAGEVTLPTIANHIATYTNTTGHLSEDPATAISGGNIQAGLSGTAGTLASFPGTASNGSLIVKAINNSGGFNSTISNTNIGQATVYSMPDAGAATANFIISASAGTQHITTGAFEVDAGVISSGISTGGTAGGFIAYPATASNGSLRLTPVGNAGNFAATISNVSTLGQASVYTIPDPAGATGNFAVAAAALVNNNLIKASGTAGLIADSGIATSLVDTSLSSTTATSNKIFVVTIPAGFAALATSGHVAVMAAPSGTSQFKIMNIRMMYTASGLSGGGGNRLLTLTDGTIVFNQAGITAALLGTPVYTLWGGTGNPLPGSVSTISTAGAAIYLVYSGGTTDYTAGSVTIEVELAQITA